MIQKKDLKVCKKELIINQETISQNGEDVFIREISPSWIKNTFDVRPWGHRKKMPDNHFVFNPEVK